MGSAYLLVGRKVIEQVINDVGAKNLDTDFIGVCLGILFNLHVKTKHDSESIIQR
jgi:hypothetical protein